MIKGNIIMLNALHLNSVPMNGSKEVQGNSASGGGGIVPIPPSIPKFILNAYVQNGVVTATLDGKAISLPYEDYEGTEIEVSVTPNEGYEFKGWDDGNLSNPRRVVLSRNVTLSASCSEIVKPIPTYTISAVVSNGKVSAKRNGSAVNLPFTANEGDTIVLEVTPNDGYTFEGWADGNTDNPRTITMTADVVLSAQCVEVVEPPVGNYIQFEDKAVEAICVANWSSDGVGLTEEDAAAVTSIGTTFKGNTEITSFDELRYFTGVTTINANAFKGCTALRKISFENITKVGNDAAWNAGAFDGCTSLERAIMPKVTEIANYSFANCSSLAEAYMPNVTLIGSAAFKGTRIGGSHTIEYCQSIGASAFKETYIEEIIAPSLTSIAGTWDGGAFADCRKLKNVRIGDATALGERTFLNCSALETFIISAAIPPSLHVALFSGASSTFLIYVPDASLEAYRTATNWNTYADRIHPLSEIEGSLVFYDKLVGDGTAYINTEYYPKGTDAFAWDAEPAPNANRFIWGMKASNISLGALYYGSEQSYYLAGAATAYNVREDNSTRFSRTMLVRDDGEVYSHILVSENGETILATSSKDNGVATKTSNKPIYIFAAQTSAADISPDRRYTGAIYSFVITDIDGNTIMSLKPCTWNGDAGMWDEVGNKFYGNAAASGEFTAAND